MHDITTPTSPTSPIASLLHFINLLLPPLHLLTYSSLLGMELYQTFFLTHLTHRALPLSQFRTLQKRVFPAYFDLQVLLVAVLAATATATATATPTAMAMATVRPSRLVRDLLAGVGWWRLGGGEDTGVGAVVVAMLPIGVMVGSAGWNWVIWGPRTVEAMGDVVRQETRDRAKRKDVDGDVNVVVTMSEEMKDVKRKFAKAHAMNIHINLVTIVATVWYGFMLAPEISCRPV